MVRRWYSEWKRNKKLDDNEIVGHETRVLVDIVGRLRARLSKTPRRDLSVFQPVEGDVEHGTFDDRLRWMTCSARSTPKNRAGFAAWSGGRNQVGSGGGVDGIDTGADDGASKSSTGGQKGRGAARKGGKPGHTRSHQATAGET